MDITGSFVLVSYLSSSSSSRDTYPKLRKVYYFESVCLQPKNREMLLQRF